MLRPGNRDDVFALRQHPRERELGRRAIFFARDLAHPLHQIEVALEILTLKTRRLPPVIIRRQIFELLKEGDDSLAGNEGLKGKCITPIDEAELLMPVTPNAFVDFYSGITLKAMGFPTTMFTVLFAVARTVGWISQWKEMIEDPQQKIGRPRQLYTGATHRDYVPISRRK